MNIVSQNKHSRIYSKVYVIKKNSRVNLASTVVFIGEQE